MKTLAVFTAMQDAFEAKFGPPAERDLDSNGIGLFDAHLLRFPCGLEVAVWRFHEQRGRATSAYEIHATEHDLAHIGFHLGVSVADMDLWTDGDGNAVAPEAPKSVTLWCRDDNGNEREVASYTNRCEAEAARDAFAARGHKQHYWVA